MKKSLLKVLLLIGVFCLTTTSYGQFVTEVAGTDTTVFPADGDVFTDPSDGTNGGPGCECSTTSSVYLGDYPNCNCVTETTLSAPPGAQISVTFTQFRVFGAFDWLAIFDGSAAVTATNGGGTGTNPSSTDPELWRSSADGDELIDMTNASSVTFTSTNGSLTFASRFSGVVNTCGWEATVAIIGGGPPPVEIPQQNAVLTACADFVDGDIYTDSGGTAGNYSVSELSTLELVALPGETVSVTFSAFEVEAGTTNCWDNLTVVGDAGGMDATYAGDDNDGGAGLVCTDATDAAGNPTLGPFVSAPGGSLSFTFDSDTSVTDPGWEAVIGVTGVCNVGMPPEIFCPIDITENSDPGVCGGVVNYAAVALDDEDGNISANIVSSHPSGSTFDVGTTTVTLSITDSDGNNAMCTFDVTILDIEAPTITCPADITQTNDAGLCGANVTVPAPTVMDNCPIVANNPPPTVSSPVTDFIFDAAGLADTPTTIMGTQVSIGGDVTMTADYDGDFGFGGEAFVLEGPDGSTIFSNSAQVGGDCAGYSDTFTVLEADWNNWVTTFGPDLTFVLLADGDVDGPGLCDPDNFYQLTAVQGMVAGSTLGNDFTGTNDASGFYPVGTTTVTWTYTDAAGFSASCTMDVTVTDDEAPVIACQGSETPSFGSATEVVGTPIPDNNPAGLTSTLVVTDDFDITDLNVNLDIDHSWIGDLIVTLTAPDGTTASALVDRPGVPDVSTVGCNNTVNAINLDMDDEAVDPIEGPCLTEYNGSFIPNEALSAFDGMSTMGTWTLFITDNAGLDTGSLNSWTLNYEYLAAATPPADIVLDANGMATVNVIDLLSSVSDNCGVVTATTDVTGIAPATITTLFDSNNGGDLGGVVYFDIVVDPSGDITLTDLDTNTAELGAFTIEMYTLEGTHVGNMADPSVWTLAATGSGTAAGVNLPSNAVLDTQVVLTAGTSYGVALVMDATHGHDYSGTGTDPAPGMLSYSNANMTINLGSGANVPFVGGEFTPRVWNGTLNYLADSTTPVPVEMINLDCSDVGVSTVDITVTDAAGNTSMCTATINVIDDTDPILVCQDFTLELGPDGTAMLDPFDMIDLAATIEACGIDEAGVNMDDFTCADIGTPIEITIFVADPSLNTDACTAFLTVVDLLGPEVTCPGDITVDPGANNQLYEVPDYFADGLASAVDNCTDPLTIFGQDPAPGSLLPDGTYTVTLSSTDEYGNIGECTFELTVESILGVNDNTLDAGVTMYPNPAQGQVTIANTSNILLEKATMFDVNGKLVNTTNLSDMQGEITIDISKLASGVYIVQIEGENASVVKRLIKE